MKFEWILPLLPVAVLVVIAIVIYKKKKKTTTVLSVDEIVGLQGKVVSFVDNLSGAVSVRGTEWSARTTTDDYTIDVGKTVTVLAVEGVQLIVK